MQASTEPSTASSTASGADHAGHPGSVVRATDLRATGERIDTLLDASAAGGAVARERAEELVRLLTDLYGAGLERLMELLHESGRLDDQLLTALADDDLVSSLLLVHGLHPESAETRVERALESVRPYLGSHGGDVQLLGVSEQGEVRLRLLGSCDGCPSSAVTLQLAVEGAIEAAAPEVTDIVVEKEETPAAGTRGVIPVESLRSRLAAEPLGGAGSTAGWHAVPELAQLAPGAVLGFAVQQTPLLGCRVGSDLFVFTDRCPRCGASLAGAALARRMAAPTGDAVLRCPTCRMHYEVRRAGACVEDPELHLTPLPVLADGPVVSVALATAVPA